MPILVICDECGQSTRVKDQMAGRSIRCRGCGEYVEVPDGDDDGFIQTGDYAVSGPAKRPRDEFRDDWRDEEDVKASRRRQRRSDDFRLLIRLVSVAVGIAVALMIPFVLGKMRKGEIPFFGNQAPAPADEQANRANVPAPWPDAKPAPGAPSGAGNSDARSVTNAPANSPKVPPPMPPVVPPVNPPMAPPFTTFSPRRGNPPFTNRAPTAPDPSAPRPPARSAPRTPARTGTKTAMVGGPGGFPFEGVAPEGPLLGLQYSLGSWAGEQVIGRLEPVYDQSNPNGPLKAVVARKGYAVGALEVDSGTLVNAVRIVFMAIDDDGKLNPSKSYASEWIGKHSRRTTETIDGEGATVIGVHGRRGAVVDAIGLVLE